MHSLAFLTSWCLIVHRDMYCLKNSANSKNYVCNVKKEMIRIAGNKKSLLVIIALGYVIPPCHIG
jgi:hypothetical protein